MQNIKDLQINIEILRERLNKLIEDNDFKLGNREIIDLSQKLDTLIDTYTKIRGNKFLS
ncbi:aspartyl-phosphate phosphatase Spo0E family protein [Tepidibacter formicigenes]|jgi:hypothetical protein|uniref:Spo0E like sporulation regulatory protein n=1 Tax=Tepidibacter formicigenes DSM 15518 TaxID=1123349 RepID=A0A1M6MHL2_9FIRM|nr:aspartyl-phosphate phosphatase Spo0E family protein [Tepidibacter formicigenes]SHJ83009.1 Spo0E like sporulation regulatory protein [Tepidibacter formicigenes DSM 15518]